MAQLWQRLRRTLRSAALALCLMLVISLGACSSAGRLSGNYVEDTVAVSQSLLTAIAIAPDDPGRAEAEQEARGLINDYMARYRPNRQVNGLASFTTMQTALNSLAGHYANYANRPLPDALKDRLGKELAKAGSSASRGA